MNVSQQQSETWLFRHSKALFTRLFQVYPAKDRKSQIQCFEHFHKEAYYSKGNRGLLIFLAVTLLNLIFVNLRYGTTPGLFRAVVLWVGLQTYQVVQRTAQSLVKVIPHSTYTVPGAAQQPLAAIVIEITYVSVLVGGLVVGVQMVLPTPRIAPGVISSCLQPLCLRREEPTVVPTGTLPIDPITGALESGHVPSLTHKPDTVSQSTARIGHSSVDNIGVYGSETTSPHQTSLVRAIDADTSAVASATAIANAAEPSGTSVQPSAARSSSPRVTSPTPTPDTPTPTPDTPTPDTPTPTPDTPTPDTPTPDTPTPTPDTPTPTPDTPTPTPDTPPEDLLIAAEADAYVRNGENYAGTNYGKLPILIAKDGGADLFDRCVYLKFDLHAVQGLTYRALLILTVDQLPNGDPAPIKLFSANDNWWEDTITYNSHPASGSTPIAEAVISDRTTIVFDVTNYVNDQILGDKIVTIMLADDTLARRMIRFYSREGAAPPALKLISVPVGS